MFSLPPTAQRVARNTSQTTNRHLAAKTAKRLMKLSLEDSQAMKNRIRQLDQEWDTERILETEAAGLILLGLGLGATIHKRWYLLSGITAGFLMQHALQGWCPTLPFLRSMGVRTAQEIEAERANIQAMMAQRIGDEWN